MLKTNIAFLALLQLVNFSSPLLIVAHTSRSLGLEMFGLTVFVQAVMQYVALISNWGFDLSATRLVAGSRESADLRDIFSRVWTAQWMILAVLLCVLLLSCMVLHLLGQRYDLYLIGFLFVIGGVLMPGWFYQGTEKIKLFASAQMIAKIAVLPLYFLFVHDPGDVRVVVFLNCLPVLFAGIFLLWWGHGFGFVPYGFCEVRKGWQEIVKGREIFFSQFLVSLYTMLTPVVLGMVSGSSSVGIYNIAERLRAACVAVLSPISQSLFPRMSFLFSNDQGGAFRVLRKASLVLLAIAGLEGVVLFVFSEELVRTIGGSQFSEAALVVKIFSVVPLLVMVSNICGLQVLLPLGFDGLFGTVYRWAALISLILMAPLIMGFQHYGAAWVVVVAEFVSAFGMAIYATKRLAGRIR